MKRIGSKLFRTLAWSVLFWLAAAPDARAFCGFYVGKADAKLWNRASQVVIARERDRTVISMLNDYEGDLTEFALVVPVPTVLSKEQIHVGDPEVFRRLDAFTAPRLVEYFDPDPCRVAFLEEMRSFDAASAPAAKSGLRRERAGALGVTVEAEYTIGEYDIVILSAKESGGLETWLRESGYRIPKGASRALRPYIRQDMRFFVAKVNLEERRKTGLTHLRPLQFAFEDRRFMLPIRLGMINAKGAQDLVVYVLTREGRVETTNYPTKKLPTGMDLPIYVKDDFGTFYRSMFDEQVRRDGMRTIFTEHFWDMGWCDPCAADPLSPEELRKLGVFWLDRPEERSRIWPGPAPMPGAVPVLVTRLHVRYSHETFPEDLVFQETKDRENFQARYVLRHPWNGSPDACDAADSYFRGVRERQEAEARKLAELTGWELATIRGKMDLDREPPAARPWWERLW